jgi:hypothetical protein
MPILAPLPTDLFAPSGPSAGLFAGALNSEHALSPGTGRTRRWWYAAAASADASLSLGVAVVDLGLGGTAFAWMCETGSVREFSRRLFGSRVEVGADPTQGAHARGRALDVRFDGAGGVDVAIDDFGGASVKFAWTARQVSSAVCATATAHGGTNLTQKAAGHQVSGWLNVAGDHQEIDGFGWYDWTAGRQDRHTVWRWAAGAGRSRDGRRVGLNVSTGMNAHGDGENVAWIDGEPVALNVVDLGPLRAMDLHGPWRVQGDTWQLDFEPLGVRAARENLLVVRSNYVQPIGIFQGSLPGPEGTTVDIDTLAGVTEDHEAWW